MIDMDRARPANGSCPRHQHLGEWTRPDAGPAWTIGALAPGDHADATRLFLKLHTYNARLDPRFALSTDWERHLDPVLSRLDSGIEGAGFLARDPTGQAVGLVLAELHHDAPLWALRDWLELAAVYVEPMWRGTGLAAALVARVEGWAHTVGVKTIGLYVTASNARALAFYDKEGFRPTQFILRKQVAAAH